MKSSRFALIIVVSIILSWSCPCSAAAAEQDKAEPSGEVGIRFGDDVLVADLDPDIEGHPDMVSSDLYGYFIATESMEAGNTIINVYNSTDFGNTWQFCFGIYSPGHLDELKDPALALPEITQDFLYLIFEANTQIRVAIFDLSIYDVVWVYDVETNPLGVHHPRIVTDDIDYPGNYWLYVTYISGTLTDRQDAYVVKTAVSTDNAATWGSFGELHLADNAMQPRPDIAFGEYTLYVTYDAPAPFPGTELDVFVRRSTDLGTTWESEINLCTGTTIDCYDPRIAAIHGDAGSGGEVVTVYTKDYIGDLDVWFGFSADHGVSWTGDYCLACTVEYDEERPDIDADPSYGWFHTAFWRDYEIAYTRAHRSAPWLWDPLMVISDTAQASREFYPPTTAFDWGTGHHSVAWSDFRTPTHAIFFDKYDWQAGTISGSLTCNPPDGILPFVTNMTVLLNNEYGGQIRRIAGRIDISVAGGNYFPNWRAGSTNVAAGGSYVTAWNQTIPSYGSLVGTNVFILVAEDVTPSPYNQPPYPASGDTTLDDCTVTGFLP